MNYTNEQLAKELDDFIGGQIFMRDGEMPVTVTMSGHKWQRIISALYGPAEVPAVSAEEIAMFYPSPTATSSGTQKEKS
jgi:hypothetical protein